jgi:hypothetical protein
LYRISVPLCQRRGIVKIPAVAKRRTLFFQQTARSALAGEGIVGTPVGKWYFFTIGLNSDDRSISPDS